jgi:crossover junction endodeoxyribonuclease RusA
MTVEPVFSVSVPFPGADLSPNTRSHFFCLHHAKKKFKRQVYGIMRCAEGLRDFKAAIKTADRATMQLVFCPNQKRRYDVDNLIARMKSGIDAIAECLEVNDSMFDYQAGVVYDAEIQNVVLVKFILKGINDASMV